MSKGKTLEQQMQERAKELFKQEAFPEAAWNAEIQMPLAENPGLRDAVKAAAAANERIRKPS